MGSSPGERFYSSRTWQYPEGFFRDYVHGKPDWTVREFNLERDLFAAQHGVIGVSVYAQDPDLSPFRAAGGKLLMWHGWQDTGIPARNSVRYYQEVLQSMGGHDTVDQFMRLFMGTGVGHCGGGIGPDAIGAAFNTPAPVRDTQHDIVEAVVNWLTSGNAPEVIIASKIGANGEVISQRPWCAYPDVAVWDGEGDRNKASSYSCPD
jgi:feruloyl esterase